MNQTSVLRTVSVSGFDPHGEPEIRERSDGSVLLVFNLMPPSFAEDDEAAFADFDKQLERALGVEVGWQDREAFLIRRPRGDTVAKAKAFLEGYKHPSADRPR